MARVRIPRELMTYFKNQREIQRFFDLLSVTTPAVESEQNTKIISDTTYSLTSADGSITINASVNPVTIVLPTPNIYKGKIYRIDVLDDTNTVLISGNLNNSIQTFQMWVEESLIIQDNGSSYRTK